MTQLEIKREAVRKPFNRRRKACPFSGPNAPKIDYKDTKLLARYTSERGKIVPSRISAVSAKKQRELATAIKRSRFLARKRDRLMAVASSRCFFAETAEMRDGTIFPRSDV